METWNPAVTDFSDFWRFWAGIQKYKNLASLIMCLSFHICVKRIEKSVDGPGKGRMWLKRSLKEMLLKLKTHYRGRGRGQPYLGIVKGKTSETWKLKKSSPEKVMVHSGGGVISTPPPLTPANKYLYAPWVDTIKKKISIYTRKTAIIMKRQIVQYCIMEMKNNSINEIHESNPFVLFFSKLSKIYLEGRRK